MNKIKKKYLFIDECGAPGFYGKRKKLLVGQPGYQPLLNVGMIITENRKLLRKKVLEFQESIAADPLYKNIPSLNKTKGWYLHAKDDHPEVRVKFFEFIRNLKGFETYVVIGRKKLELFNKKHNNNPTEFFFDLLYHLLKNRLNKTDEYYQLYLAQQQSIAMHHFTKAVNKAIIYDNIKSQCDIGLSSKYPEMSIIDYLLWALQRYIIKKEERFFKALIDKYEFILDVYDFDNLENNQNYYGKQNPFDLKKATDFEL